MQSIILKNFKSYQNQSLSNFNSRINVVLGLNGQGKSNFFKAITYLFTEKYTINRTEFNSILNRGANPEQAQASVEAILKTNNDIQKQTYKISKTWKNYTNQDVKINQKSRSKQEFENFIQSFGFSYSNPYNIVQQGKVTQIASMSQNQLYLLLQETAGVKKFYKKNQQAAGNLTKIQNDLSQIEQNLRFLKEKVSQVEQKKNQYQFYQVQDKVRKIQKKREFLNYFESVQKVLRSIKQHHTKILKDLNQKINLQINLLEQIQEKELHIKRLNQKSLFYQKQQSPQIKSSSINKKEIKQQILKTKEKIKMLEAKISGQQKIFTKLKQNLTKFEKQLSIYRQKYEMIKLDFQIQGESNDTKKIKHAYNQKIKSEQQIIKNTQEQIKKLDNMKKQFKIVKCNKQIQECEKLKQQKNTQLNLLNSNRCSLIDIGRKKINLECEVNSVLSKKKNQEQMFRKILPLIDLKLLAFLQQSQIKGVYGYLLSYVNINKDVSFAYQLAGLSKLCTLLVQDDKVASEVVKINKKFKGKNINILPLSFVKSQIKESRSYPKTQNAYSLLNNQWLSFKIPKQFKQDIKQSIQKIIHNTFYKYILVDDYITALKISKQYNLNCITPDRQIVYADNYICKVGRQQLYEKGKIQIYQNLEILNTKLNSLTKQINSFFKKQIQLQNKQIQITILFESLTLKIIYLQKTIDQAQKIKSIIDKLDYKKKLLQQSIIKNKITIGQYQKTLKNIQNNIKPKFKELDLNQSKQQYFSCKLKVDSLLGQIYQAQRQLAFQKKNKNLLYDEIKTLKQNIQSDYLSRQNIIQQIQKQKHENNLTISILNKDLAKVLEEKTNLKQKQLELLDQIIVQEQNQKHIQNKIHNLGQFNELQQDQIQQLSHSMSLKLNIQYLNNKKKQYYTAADKIFFKKITQYLDQVAQYSKNTEQLKNKKRKLQNYIQKSTKQSKQYMDTFIKKFNTNFKKYFLRIVPNGKVDLRTKILTQKLKGINKNAYSLQIKVSFNEQQGIRRWSEFSGGQKTVLALCIILSIQKCQPSPFCVLDQVDAALDTNCLDKVLQIIIQQSQNCQYFITTFKKSILQIPDQITNYYLVKVFDRKSSIHKVEKEQIQNFFTQFRN